MIHFFLGHWRCLCNFAQDPNSQTDYTGVKFRLQRRLNISCSQKGSTPLEKSVRVEGEINIQVKPDRLVEQWKQKEARKYNDPDWLLGSRLI